MKLLFILSFTLLNTISCKKETTTSPPLPSNPVEAKILGKWNISSVHHININNGNKTEKTITGQDGDFFEFTTTNGKKIFVNIQPILEATLKMYLSEYTYEILRLDETNSDFISLVHPVTGIKTYYTIKKLTATDLILYDRNEYSPGDNSDEITITFTKKI